MAETAATPTESTAATPEAPTMEQELQALFKSEEGTPTPEVKAEGEAVTEPVKEENQTPDINSQLDEIAKDGETPTPEAPKLSEEHQRILSAIPNLQSAQQLAQNSQYFEQLNSAIANRDFDTVETMFAADAFEDFREHIYKKYGESFVDRWVAEKEGTAPIHKGMTSLERRIQQLESEKAAQHNQTTTQQQKAAQAKVSQDYVNHIGGLFDKISFSANDRRWVFADINNRVAADPHVRAAINSGNIRAVNKIFSEAVKEYSEKDQAQQIKKETTLAAQDQKKPLASPGAVAVQSDKITDETIASAPKEQRSALLERKMNQELAELFRK